jgi:hypothetical protein
LKGLTGAGQQFIVIHKILYAENRLPLKEAGDFFEKNLAISTFPA